MASRSTKPEPGRVLHVDFSTPRRELHPTLCGLGDTAAGQGAPSSVEMIARLIAEKADPCTIDGDLEVICRLLRRYCSWSDENLSRLSRAVATALDHRAAPRRDRPGRRTPFRD